MAIRSSATGGAYGRLQKTANAAYGQKLDDVADIVEEVMTDAENEAKKHIATRGVRDTVPNMDGRGTGKMEAAVDHRVTRLRDTVHGQVGWLPGRPRRPEYGWQESGTRELGEPSGTPSPTPGENRGIRPMFAILDASTHAAEELRERFR